MSLPVNVDPFASVRQVVDQLPVMMMAIDDQGRVLFWNRECERLTGYSYDELQGDSRSLLKLCADGHSHEQFLEIWDAAIEPGACWECALNARNGEIRTIRWSKTEAPFPIDRCRGWAVGVDLTELRRTATALRESEARFRVAFEKAAIGIVIASPDGHIIRVNQAFAEMIGYQSHDLIGRPFIELSHPDDRAGGIAAVASMIRGELDNVNVTKRYIRRDGGFVWARLSAALVRDEHQEPLMFVAIVEDITQLRQTEDELSRNRAVLEAAIEVCPVGLIIADAPDVTIRVANSAARQIRGQTSQSLTDIASSDHSLNWQTCHADGTPYDPTELPLSRAVLKGETVENVEVGIRRDDGEIRRVLANAAPVRDADGKVSAGVVLFTDLTERLHAEEQLRHQMQRTEVILRSALDGFILIDITGNLLDVNQAYCEMVGYTHEELLKMHLRELEAVMSPEEIQLSIGRVIAEGKLQFETHHRCKNGKQIDLEVSVTTLQGPTGIQMAAFIRDITDRKTAQRLIQRANDQLEQRVRERTQALASANEELQAFAYSTSHDLRAPLRAMEGFARALNEDCYGELGDLGKSYVDQIMLSAGRMDQLINDLLAYSRLGRPGMRSKPVDVDRAVSDVLERMKNEIDTSGAEIKIMPDLGWVMANGVAFEQIVANLVSNAIKFVSPGQTSQVTISADRRQRMLRLTVADNGIGIDPARHSEIFQVFKRLHGIESYQGTGIGLAIVSRAARRMGGTFGVDSTPGVGSRFWVELPWTPAGTN